MKKYLLPDGTCKVAPLPSHVSSHFGNNLKRYILYQSYVNNVSQKKIKCELEDVGISMSAGEIHNSIVESQELLGKEYEDVGSTGLITAREIRVDDTGCRHMGKNGSCLVIQNDLYTFFQSSLSKSRMQFLKVLRGTHIDYVLNEVALNYIEQYKPKATLLDKLTKLVDINFADKQSWDNALKDADITALNTGAKLLTVIEEAGLLGSAIEHGLDPNIVLLSDGARQYVMFVHALCWVHAERAIKKLLPKNDEEAVEIEKIRDQVWKFYETLKDYKNNPTPSAKKAIDQQFDQLFGQKVINDDLGIVLRSFLLKKAELLRVLDYPHIPLHNNSSEQAIRCMVIKGNISGGTRSDQGRYIRDMFASLIKTCRKHKISVWDFLGDRINKVGQIPYLPDLIRQKAQLKMASP